jgi:uncharacterized protein YegL
MKKKIVLGLGALATAVAIIPLFAAFEAHVINVTAKIENALNVPIHELTFGTVFPQEKLDKFFDVALSQSFRDEDRVDDVDYFIRQKPKCWNKDEQNPIFGTVTEDPNNPDHFICKDESFEMLPLLCPYLSKHEISTDGTAPEGQNDDPVGISAFHGPIDLAAWTLAISKSFDIRGHLAKAQSDFDDQWNIDLKVPCFGNHCAQDWASFVADNDGNNNADPNAYIQPIDNEHKLFGCDLWLEVAGISLPGLGCKGNLDLMLVLDRSGSIDSGELTTLKTAANAFVTALAPSPAGVHIGQTSFSTTGTLDRHLSDDAATSTAAINALVSGGSTNLFDGITFATGELANVHAHERPAISDVMVIITDGNPNEPGTTQNAETVAKTAADAARVAGIEIFVVGIGGDVDATYLKTIANDDAHYFSATNFSDLEAVLTGLTQCTE